MDNGKTWSKPMKTGEVKFPPPQTDGKVYTGGEWKIPAEAPPYVEVYAESLLELQDGSLLLFAFGWTQKFEMRVIEGRCAREGSPWGINFCIRSTDNGQSWSAPVNLDGPPYSDENWLLIKGAGGSEISAAQTRDGSIVALIRPFSSPLMWESWSKDGGRSWTPMARGPFAFS